MSYFVVCSFDLKDASYDDYQNAYADLARIGLNRKVISGQGREVLLPTTTCAGEFTGNSADEISNNLSNKVQTAFKSRRFKSEIFIFVGGNWAWGHTTT